MDKMYNLNATRLCMTPRMFHAPFLFLIYLVLMNIFMLIIERGMLNTNIEV